MNRKVIIALIAMAVALAFVGTTTLAFAGTPPGKIVLDKAKNKKPGVAFDHKDHGERIDCLDCHHTAKTKEEAESCYNCHGKEEGIPDPGIGSQKNNPFHIKCRGCHLDLKKQKKETGPTICKQCHKP